MTSKNILEIGNVTQTTKYKPQDEKYHDSWIEFWKTETGMSRPQACCVMDCKHDEPVTSEDIVGGHVYVSAELSKAIENDLESFCKDHSRRAFNGFSLNNGYWYKIYGTLIVMMRCGNELVKTKGGNLVCIAPICNSCNQREDKYLLHNNTAAGQ